MKELNDHEPDDWANTSLMTYSECPGSINEFDDCQKLSSENTKLERIADEIAIFQNFESLCQSKILWIKIEKKKSNTSTAGPKPNQ